MRQCAPCIHRADPDPSVAATWPSRLELIRETQLGLRAAVAEAAEPRSLLRHTHPPWSGAALERAPETAHERGRAVDRGRGPEDVEVGSLEHDADAVLREPPSIGAVHVVNGPSRGDVRADAAERREEGGELGRETACRVGHRAEQGEAAPDDVVEPTGRLAAPHLALRAEMAGERVTVDQQPWTDRRGWQRRRGAPVLYGGDHRGIARGGLGGGGNTDHPAQLDHRPDPPADPRDAL